MRSRKIYIVCLLFLVGLTSNAQVVTYQILPDSKVTITGTSTMHDWTSNVNKFSGKIQIRKAFAQKSVPKKGDSFENMDFRIDVKSIESGRGAVMDNRTYEALKAETNPEIIFTLKKSEVSEIKNAATGMFVLNTRGELTIAGVTKPIEMVVEGQKLKNGSFKFTGSKALKMTEYGIKPPTAMFGQIVTGDDVTIQFDLLAGVKK